MKCSLLTHDKSAITLKPQQKKTAKSLQYTNLNNLHYVSLTHVTSRTKDEKRVWLAARSFYILLNCSHPKMSMRWARAISKIKL